MTMEEEVLIGLTTNSKHTNPLPKADEIRCKEQEVWIGLTTPNMIKDIFEEVP